MPTATLTWSENHGDSVAQSTFGATNQGAIQLLNNYFTALAAFSDFPWQVASFEGTTSPWQVTLKRKTGAAGRIIFIGVTTAPGATYNPQLGSISWSSTGVRSGFFPEATSDTPANILATSGDVFTNPGNSTGLGPNIQLTTGTHTATAWACEDGVFVRYGPPASFAQQIISGMMLEDDSGNSSPITAAFSSLIESTSPSTSPTIALSGGYSLLSSVSIHYGAGWIQQSSLAGYTRDNGAKKAWFLPRSLCSLFLPPAQLLKYKFRQIAFGPTTLAGYERLASTGDVLQAQNTGPVISSTYPWLTNFKV